MIGVYTKDWTHPISYAGSDDALAAATLANSYFTVINIDGPDAGASEVASPGVPASLVFDDSNSRPEERAAYQASMDLVEYMLQLDGDFELFNEPVRVHVNIPAACQAYAWGGARLIDFSAAAEYCHAYGRMMPIVWHEWGHLVDWFQDESSFQGGEFGMSEGPADVMSMLMTRDPHIGRGYSLGNCDSMQRSLDNGLRYPEDVYHGGGDDSGQEYRAGTVIGGFHWEALRRLKVEFGDERAALLAGRNWHWGRKLLRPAAVVEEVFATILADDDDDDLSNGTPHYAVYREAALYKGFPVPETAIVGACCFSDGSCVEVEWSVCAPDGVWAGESTSCDPSPCGPKEGAWRALGEGLDGSVHGLAHYRGEVVAVGAFANSDSTAVGNIARWTGSEWVGFGDGADGPVLVAFAWGDSLCIGGSFTEIDGVSANNIALWDGSTWMALGDGFDDTVRAIYVYDGALIAGGAFLNSGLSPVSRLGTWDGTNWSTIGGGVNGPVSALAVYQGALVTGGDFTSAGGQAALNVGRWNRTEWNQLGAGFDGPVHSLLAEGSQLFAGGDFQHSGSTSVSHVARLWDSHWEPLGQGTNGPVYSMAGDNGAIVVGGAFSSTGGVAATNVARCWTRVPPYEPTGPELESFWSAYSTGAADSVFAVTATSRSDVWMGGAFESAGAVSASHVANWGQYPAGAMGTPLDQRPLLLSVFPNPASSGGVDITLSLARESEVTVEIYSVGGARIRALASLSSGVRRQTYRWDFRDDHGHRAARGVYFVRATSDAGSTASRVVILD